MTHPSPAPHKAVTLRDVAQAAGVSIATVSYSLNGGGTIGEEVRERVRAVAEEIGYRPNRSAQAIRTGRSMSLGLIVPDLNNPYYPALAQSVERAAREEGYTVVLLDTSGMGGDEVGAIRYLENHGVDGVVWCQTSGRMAGAAADYQIPIVVIGSPSIEFDNVTVDDETGGRLAARHLIAKGHRRIGVLSGAAVPKEFDNRYLGFVNEIGNRAEIVFDLTTAYSIDLAPAIAGRIGRRDITAIMCGNDMIAIGVLRALRQSGLAVPEDVSVIGFDDIPWSAIVTPALTTIRQPVAEMAAVAMTLLLGRITEPGRNVRHFKVDVKLIGRDSVASLSAIPGEADPGSPSGFA